MRLNCIPYLALDYFCFLMEKYTEFFKKGIYKCKKCGNVLFPSDAKFKSGTAWPSFREALPGAIAMKPDHSLGMERTEAVCAKCGEHLGHIFPDGKLCGDTDPNAGDRFCILSDSLDFSQKEEKS